MIQKLLNLLAYPRSVILTLYGIVHTVVMSLLVVFAAVVLRSRRMIDWCVQAWSRPLLVLGGISVDVRGAEFARGSTKGVLFVFNHTSLFDIPILFAYIPRRFMFGAKIELFKIPFFGRAMEVCGILPIDRGNRNKVMKVYQAAIARVEQGESFALAPEGTRQGDGMQLGRFKRGPFEFAINAQMDVVPVVVAGAGKILPPHTFFPNWGVWRRPVIVSILPPVPTAGLSMELVDGLQDKVRAQMDMVFQKTNEELIQHPC